MIVVTLELVVLLPGPLLATWHGRLEECGERIMQMKQPIHPISYSASQSVHSVCLSILSVCPVIPLNTQGSSLGLKIRNTSTTTKTRVAYGNSPGMRVNTRQVNSIRGTSSVRYTENVPLVEFMHLECTRMQGDVPLVEFMHLELTHLPGDVPLVEFMHLEITCMPGDVPLVEFMYLVVTRMPGELP